MVKGISYLTNALIAIIFSCFASSCQANINLKTLQRKPNQQEKAIPNITYGELLAHPKSEYLMFPVIGVYSENKQLASNWFSSHSSETKNKIHNIVFYDKKEGTSYLLLRNKAWILSYDLIERNAPGRGSKRFWLYRIINKDTNGDQQLTTEDAIIGYISDLSGRNLKQITPNNSQMKNWKVIESMGSIFIQIIKNTNNDKKITEEDTSNYIRINLDNIETVTEVFTPDTEEEIKSILNK
ncbi:MAG: hypothetical protein VKL59_00935 [Nostocaceae cyanobacterium]|nr:hypothetical protein [Nostocaceae cyanobacterium]